MMSRKAFRGVLHNFIETYTSRYSDYDGYWLFGKLINELEQFNINLLNTEVEASERTVITTAVQLATTKFKDQVEKAGLNLSYIQEASLVITKLPDLRNGWVNGHRAAGFDLSFVASAMLHKGKTYECKKSAFVAPHDPSVELRSGRIS